MPLWKVSDSLDFFFFADGKNVIDYDSVLLSLGKSYVGHSLIQAVSNKKSFSSHICTVVKKSW